MSLLRPLSVVLFGLLLAGCQKPAPPGPPPLPVTFAEVTTADVPLYLETFGKGVTVAAVTIVPQVTGVLSETRFSEGATVKRGDVIFQIDARPYQAALTQAEGALQSAQASLVLAQQNLARQQKLYETKVNDIQDFQNAQATAQGAQGELLSSQAALQNAKINVGYCTITSPIDGRTGPYLINTGNVVTANSSQLVNIQTQAPIYVDYAISEADLPRLRQYLDPAAEGLPVEVTLPGAPDYLGKGTLRFIDNSVAPGTGTLEMRATLPNEDLRLWPGQFVNVRLILKTLKNALVAPSDAVLTGQTGDYVFLLAADNTVSIRPVTRGQREGDNLVIESGLAAGDRVITSGQIALAPGEKVAPVSSRSQNPPTNPPPDTAAAPAK